MKNIGKPCTGKPYARFDEGGLALPALYSTPNYPKSNINTVNGRAGHDTDEQG